MRTIEAADQIVVLDKGVVAEKGNHDTLMKKNGLYRKLVDLQTEEMCIRDRDMAVNKTINKRTNTHGAMRNCIEYVLRQDKTSELLTYVTGPYRHDEIDYDLVYRTFLEEKKMWNKDTGRMYAHNIISWHKDEQITPEQAFEFGKEFAEKWFQGFQTLVACLLYTSYTADQ